MFNRFKRYHAKRRLVLSLVFVFGLTGTKAQIISLDTIITQAIFYLGDTIPCSTLSAVRVDCRLTDAQKKHWRNTTDYAMLYTLPILMLGKQV